MGPFEIRPAMADDEARIVDIYNSHQQGRVPLTVARCRAECAEAGADDRRVQLVASRDNTVVGFGGYHWAWWTGHPGVSSMDIRVDPRYCRQGAAASLFDQLQSRLTARGAERIVGWIRSDSEASRGFAARIGCRATGQVIQEYHLTIAEADVSGCADLKTRLGREGLRIASLAELGAVDESFLRALQRLWANSGDDPPDPEHLYASFDGWQQQVLHAAGLTPETHWVALDGTRPVGMTFLKQLDDHVFENDYTGVASTHRRRGIATALKLCAIKWAREQGVESFTTSSETNNRSMIGINTRLGYHPGTKLCEVARDLA
jgi:mycothiol synthase